MGDPQAVRAAWRGLGHQLAAKRKAAKLSQQELADRTNYSRSSIANVEIGLQHVNRTFWETADTLLGATEELLQMYDAAETLQRAHQRPAGNQAAVRAPHQVPDQIPVADSWSSRYSLDLPAALRGYDLRGREVGAPWSVELSTATVEDVKRRAALSLPALSLAAAALPAEPWSRLSHVLQHPNQLDDLTLDCLEGETAKLFRQEELLPASQLWEQLELHVKRFDLLIGRVPAAYERQVLSTGGESMALAGWAAWDEKRYDIAQHLYGRALEAARQAGDGPLYACVLAYQSYGAEAAGDLVAARQLLSAAQGYVRSSQSAGTRAWVAAREAEIDASLSDSTGALRALERAMTAYDYAHPQRERSWTGFFTPVRLGSMAIATYARLDHSDLDPTLESVVGSLSSTDAKTKAVILADVATAAIQRGQYDRGAQLGHQALDDTLSREASLGRQRLQELHRILRDKRDIPMLATLDDRLLTHVV